MQCYDAIVTGAGPAGAAAALVLARDGARVALLDREAFPRDKPCGDLLGRAAVRECLALGVDPIALGACRVRGVALRAPGGAIVHGIAYRGERAAQEACVIPRRRFDAALVGLAVEAGATLHRLQVVAPLRDARGVVTGVTTRLDATPGPELAAPLVIGADGWGSTLARALLGPDGARPAQKGIAIRGYIEGAHDLYGRLRFFHERDLLPGCAWIFPLDDTRANVGLGTLVTEDGPPIRLVDRLDAFLHDPASPASAILDGAVCVGPALSWPLALGWRERRLSFDGALLVGDAAALVSPLSGSGIAAALRSGRLAAQAGLRALERGDTSYAMLRPYETAVRKVFRRRYALERAAQALVAHPSRLDTLARVGMRVPRSQAVAGSLLFNLG